jgi:hypothetical protein
VQIENVRQLLEDQLSAIQAIEREANIAQAKVASAQAMLQHG